MSIKSKLSSLTLNFFSWKVKNSPPITSKYVLIAAPHTSNWDFLLMLLTSYKTNVPLKWMGKKSLFKWPFSSLMIALGGVPINRDKRGSVVSVTATKIMNASKFVLVVPPEGTRSKTEFWKSGFLYIARESKIPIVFSYLDYKKKEIGFSAPINQTLHSKKIIEIADTFYKNVTGLYPENFGPIKFKEKNY
ncbi:MAG: 1-acyl-sn-glycerol-3-phosphate acyltransferase [Burkholderiaceae bacterium]